MTYDRMREIERLAVRASYLERRMKFLIEKREALCNHTEDVKFFGVTFWKTPVDPDPDTLLDINIRIAGIARLIDTLKSAEKMLIDEQAGELRVSPQDILNLVSPYKA